MDNSAKTLMEYINQLSPERKEVFNKIRKVILENLPEGFSETMSYGMPSFVVPHTLYPQGYHCNPEEPLPFISLVSQKNFISFSHMGIYSDENLKNWFVEEYAKACKYKLDMGKSCIRFKKMDHIPYELIGALCRKMDVNEWITHYENHIKK